MPTYDVNQLAAKCIGVTAFDDCSNGQISDCTRLANGNILIARQFRASEITPCQSVVWDYNSPPQTELHTIASVNEGSVAAIEIPGIRLNLIQEVSRLDNGDTLINNWIANQPQSTWPGSPQVIPLSAQKKIRWLPSDWSDLGRIGHQPNTPFQISQLRAIARSRRASNRRTVSRAGVAYPWWADACVSNSGGRKSGENRPIREHGFRCRARQTS